MAFSVLHPLKVPFFISVMLDGMLIDDDKKNLTPWAKAGQETYFVEVKGEPIRF